MKQGSVDRTSFGNVGGYTCWLQPLQPSRQLSSPPARPHSCVCKHYTHAVTIHHRFAAGAWSRYHTSHPIPNPYASTPLPGGGAPALLAGGALEPRTLHSSVTRHASDHCVITTTHVDVSPVHGWRWGPGVWGSVASLPSLTVATEPHETYTFLKALAETSLKNVCATWYEHGTSLRCCYNVSLTDTHNVRVDRTRRRGKPPSLTAWPPSQRPIASRKALSKTHPARPCTLRYGQRVADTVRWRANSESTSCQAWERRSAGQVWDCNVVLGTSAGQYGGSE